jgi:hypothetical protein
MDVEILQYIRLMAEDQGDSALLEDYEIENLAKNRRARIYFKSLETDDYFTWTYPGGFIELTSLSTSYEGTAIDAGDYTADSIAGLYTFDAEQSWICLNGWQYDVNDIIAHCWLAKGAILRGSTKSYSLGDESVDEAPTVQYCVEMYWKFCTSEGGRLELL